MALPAALRELPGDLVPKELAAVRAGDRDVAEVLFEQRRCESLAFCRTVTTVYALHRVMYADDEAQYLAAPGDYREAVEARRRLTAAGVALEAQVSTLLRLGPTAARHQIECAIGFVERLPQVFALIGANVISPKAGEVALHRSRVLTDAQAREFDGVLAERLSVDYEVLAIPALRDEVDLLVSQVDPEAAERRRRAAESDRRITFRPEEDGMAAAFALLPAHDIQEFSARVDYIAGTVCEEDPRTTAQRQADGAMQLIRGFSTLGCACEVAGCKYRAARFAGEPDADGVVTRFITMINVVINETSLTAHEAADAESGGSADGLGYLIGHGPISGEYARDLAVRSDAKVRPFGQRIDAEPASSDAPSEVHGDSERGTFDFAFEWAEIVFRLEHPHTPNDGPDDGPDDGPGDGPPPGDGPNPRPSPGPGSGAATDDPDGPGGGPGGDARALVRAGGSSGYRPSADLQRYLRLVFPRCVFPHCGRPAAKAQIDHRREFDHRNPELGGQTTAEDVQPLCLPHHQVKTAGAWIDARLPDGRILWTSPDGRKYIVAPNGIVLRLFPDLARVHWIVPERAPSNRGTDGRGTEPAPPVGPTRLQREHARREQLREANVAAMQADLEWNSRPHSEIEDRIDVTLGAPPAPRPAPSNDEPPPF